MIRVDRLTKMFGPKRAVDDISFTVEPGEVLGFLGPNGAGKSTTMRMITGFFPPTSGTVKVGGHDIVEDPIAAKKLMGYLPENAPCYMDMTVAGFLGFIADLRGLRGAAKQKQIDRVVELCFLKSVYHQSIDTLSKGYKHRTCFAQSIIHDPEVLILDEPTDGLDPNQKFEVRNLIREMGKTKVIIFSTHILEEVEAVCSRAIIIDRGKVVANGTPEELKQKAKFAGCYLATISSGPEPAKVSEKLKKIEEVTDVEFLSEKPVLQMRLHTVDKNGRAIISERIGETVLREGWKLQELRREEGRLDDVFRDITLPDTLTKTEAVK